MFTAHAYPRTISESILLTLVVTEPWFCCQSVRRKSIDITTKAEFSTFFVSFVSFLFLIRAVFLGGGKGWIKTHKLFGVKR